MFKFVVAAVGFAFVADANAASHLTDEQQEVSHSGDALQYAVPIVALGLTFLLDQDRKDGSDVLGLGLSGNDFTHMSNSPRHDLALALGRSITVTQGLKLIVNEPRPNGGSHSFPSGHTSFAFTGAEFIRKEYGWQWGIPAYLLASYVGYSRVESDAHYTHDVVAGALIGVLANHDLGELKTRYGSLSFSSAMAQPAVADRQSPGRNTLLDLPTASTPTLGVSFKLKF